MPALEPTSDPSSCALQVDDLVMRYGERTVVDHLHLRAGLGEVTVVLGPNGAGKTTTIETAEGFRRPQSGRVSVLGLDPIRDAGQLRARVGVMLQAGGFWAAVTPRTMLEHLSRLYRHPLAVQPLLDQLELDRVAGTSYRRLSGGERQKLALAAAIIGRPELAFLDEPTTGLDPTSRLRVWDLIRRLRAAGVSVLMTTHLLDEAEELADAVAIIDSGRLAASGTRGELLGGGSGVSFHARPGLALAELSTRLGAGLTVREVSAGNYRIVGSPTPAVLSALVAWCAEREVVPEQISTAERSLAEVYFEAVGRSQEGSP